MLINTHTGAVAYNGTINQNLNQLLFEMVWGAAITELENTVLTLGINGRVSETLIPALTLSQLAEISAFMDVNGYKHVNTTGKNISFAVPMGFNDSVDLEGSTLTYSLTGAAAASNIKVIAIDGNTASRNILKITSVGTKLNAEFNQPCANAKYLFVTPTTITRIKMRYSNGKTVEYSADELQHIARNHNPIAVNILGVIVGGSNSVLMGVNLSDVVSMDILASQVATYYMVEEISI